MYLGRSFTVGITSSAGMPIPRISSQPFSSRYLRAAACLMLPASRGNPDTIYD